MNASVSKRRLWIGAILFLIAVFIVSLVYLRQTGLSARVSPPELEAFAAKEIRRWATPVESRKLKNPISSSAEMLEHGRSHWADHCAICHANNGSGDTEMGRNLYPRVPDMRGAETQSRTDGELYYIIRNGVPLTGMPGWGDPKLGNFDHDTWTLVLFIRHLPILTQSEEAAMQKLNPISAKEREEEKQEDDFLNGKTPMESKHEP